MAWLVGALDILNEFNSCLVLNGLHAIKFAWTPPYTAAEIIAIIANAELQRRRSHPSLISLQKRSRCKNTESRETLPNSQNHPPPEAPVPRDRKSSRLIGVPLSVPSPFGHCLQPHRQCGRVRPHCRVALDCCRRRGGGAFNWPSL